MLKKEEKAEIVKRFQRGKDDTGSTEVQVAILTKEIERLTEHLKENKQDKHSKRGLIKKVGNRRSLLNYLKNEDVSRYKELISKLNLRK